MRLALVLLALSLPALARSPGKHTQDYHQGANGSTVSGGALARYLTVSDGVASLSGVTFTRASAGAACTDSSGGVTFPASGVPCLAGGYHARPQIANLLLWSSAFDNAAWATPSGATVTANAATAPDGSQTAELLDFTAASDAFAGLQQEDTTGTTGNNTLTVWVKSATGASQTFRLSITDKAVADYFSGELTATTTWQRFSWTASNTIADQIAAIRTNSGKTTTQLYVWGAQFEHGAFPNDYCPSGSTAATCAAEVATVPTPSGMSRTEGCAAISITPTWTGANPSAASTWFLGSGVANAVLGYDYTGGTQFLATDGTHSPFIEAGWTAGVRARFVTRWSASAGTLSVEKVGGAKSSVSGFTGFVAWPSQLYIGAKNDGTQQPLGSIIDSITLGSTPGGCQ